jgi:hypothetical protein
MYLSPKDMLLNQIKSVKSHLNWKYASVPTSTSSPSASKVLQPPNTGTSLKAKITLKVPTATPPPSASAAQPVITSTARNARVLQQIPSTNTDFKSADNSSVKVTFVSSYKDTQGNYHVIGNIQN